MGLKETFRVNEAIGSKKLFVVAYEHDYYNYLVLAATEEEALKLVAAELDDEEAEDLGPVEALEMDMSPQGVVGPLDGTEIRGLFDNTKS